MTTMNSHLIPYIDEVLLGKRSKKKGTGSEVMRRIAAPMVSGMISATFLTLLIIPAVFLLWKRHSLKT